MRLDRSSHVPLYAQLRIQLVQQIEKGALKPGDTVPTEQELMERYGVSRATVRQAMGSLVHEDFYRQYGSAPCAANASGKLGTLTGFSEEMIQQA